jgi:hypothetical protein
MVFPVVEAVKEGEAVAEVFKAEGVEGFGTNRLNGHPHPRWARSAVVDVLPPH